MLNGYQDGGAAKRTWARMLQTLGEEWLECYCQGSVMPVTTMADSVTGDKRQQLLAVVPGEIQGACTE